MDWDRKQLDLNDGKIQLVSFDFVSVLEEKSSFKMLGLTFSSKLDWGSYIISKTASKKTGALICSMKLISPMVALYLYKSTICPCMEYCCHVWPWAPSCYLELLEKLHKQIYKTVGPSLATSLESQFKKISSLSKPSKLSAVFFWCYKNII